MKKNGEDAGNVCQRPRTTKEQVNRDEKYSNLNEKSLEGINSRVNEAEE